MNLAVPSTLCYVQTETHTLMLNRNKKEKDIHLGKFNGLGGKFLDGECPEDCVHREVKEESGLTLTNPKIRGIMTFPKFKDNLDWIVFLYTATQFSGELIECNEGSLEWIETSKLKELPLWEGDYLFLEWLKKDQFFSAKFNYRDKKLVSHSVTFY